MTSEDIEQTETEARAPLPSTVITRWFLPSMVIWAGLLLSVWVYTNRIPDELRENISTLRLGATLFAVPAFAALLLGILRLVGRSKHSASRTGDMLVLWIIAFLFAVHASVLAVAIGMIASLDRAVPAATGLLMFGIGPVLGGLEHKSAMGIRTASTLADPEIWARTHRLASKLFIVAGIAGLVGLLFKGPLVLVGAIAPAALALVISVVYGAIQRPQTAPDEDPPSAVRPTDDDGSP